MKWKKRINVHTLEGSTHFLSMNSRWGRSLAWLNIISSFVYKKYIIYSWLLRTFVTTPIILTSINFLIQNKLIFTLPRRAWPYVKLIYSLTQLFWVILIIHKVYVLHQVPCPLLFQKSCTEQAPLNPSSSLDTFTNPTDTLLVGQKLGVDYTLNTETIRVIIRRCH